MWGHYLWPREELHFLAVILDCWNTVCLALKVILRRRAFLFFWFPIMLLREYFVSLPSIERALSFFRAVNKYFQSFAPPCLNNSASILLVTTRVSSILTDICWNFKLRMVDDKSTIEFQVDVYPLPSLSVCFALRAPVRYLWHFNPESVLFLQNRLPLKNSQTQI